MTAVTLTPDAKRAEVRKIADQVRAERAAGFPSLNPYTAHPAIDAFPWMTDDEFVGLIWSIRRDGLIDPILIDGDVIIDGRCRLVACTLAGVWPRFKPFKYDGDPADKDDAIESYVWSVNAMRSSMTRSQHLVYEAQLVAEHPHLADHFHELSDEAGVIVRYPDIAEQVIQFGLPLAAAYEKALERGREEERRAAERQRLEQLRAEAPFVAAMVDEGTLSLDQGLAHAEDIATAPLVAEHLQVIRSRGRRMIEDAIEIGARLTECRRLIRRDWIGWLDRELGFSDRAALDFMRVYHLALTRSENFSDLSLPVSGLYLLARPSTSEATRDDILGRASAGETISFAEIKREVSGERSADERPGQLAAVAARLAQERPDDPLIQELLILVSKMERS